MQNTGKTVIETKLARFLQYDESGFTNGKNPNTAILKTGISLNMNTKKTKKEKNDTSRPIANFEYFNKYFRPYLKSVRVDENSTRSVKVYFPDGSMASFGARSMIFFPNAKDWEMMEDEDGNISEKKASRIEAKTSFTFYFNPTDNTAGNKYHYNRGIEPYKFGWDGTEEDLRNDSALGCKEGVKQREGFLHSTNSN